MTRRTQYIALDMFDRMVNIVHTYNSEGRNIGIDHENLESLTLVCLFIASKLEEVLHPSLKRMSLSVGNSDI